MELSQHYQKGHTKKIALLGLLMAILAFGALMLISADPAHANGITSSIKNANSSDVSSSIDSAGSDFIKEVRLIAVVVLIGVIVWVGFTLYFGNGQSLANMKIRLGVIAIALVFTFQTEGMVKFLLGLVGYELPS